LAAALLLTLTLVLSACAGGPANLPSGCNHGSGGETEDRPRDYTLPVTAPVAADGVGYVGYTIPDPRANRAGYPQDQYLLAALRARDGMPLWRALVTSEFVVSSQPEELAIAGGVVLALVRGGELIAFRASDGASLWHARLAVLGTAWGGVLYTLDGSTIYALRLADGRLLWRQQPGDVLIPLVADGTNLYFAQDAGSVTALRADTGAVRWTFGPTTPTYTPGRYVRFAAANGQLYLTYLSGYPPDERPGSVRLSTVDGSSGGYVVHQPTGSTMGVNPLLAAGVVTLLIYPTSYPDPITSAAYRLSLSLSAGGSQPLWRAPVQVQVQGDVGAEAGVLAGGTSIARDAQAVYFDGALQGASHAEISAFRLEDGLLLWRQQVLASRTTGIAADSGDLFETLSGEDNPCRTPAVHEAPVIRALRGADGTVAWTQALTAAR
jgi:outer membrane protein assembly factor BamB